MNMGFHPIPLYYDNGKVRDRQKMRKHALAGKIAANSACEAGRFHIPIIRVYPFLNMEQSPIPHYFITAGKCEKRVCMARTSCASMR